MFPYLFFVRFSVSTSSGETDIHYIKASELFPKKIPWVEGGLANSTDPPFPLLPGEDILYEVTLFKYIYFEFVVIALVGSHQ